MTLILQKSRGEECLSDLRIDQFIRQELDGARETNARSHLVGCASCSARLSEMETTRAQFAQAPSILPALSSRSRAARRPAFSRWLYGGAGSVLAAAMVLFALLRPTSEPWRSKGSEHLQLFIRHEGEVRPGISGEVVAPGDRLQFTYTLAESRYFALLSRDGANLVSVYFPDGRTAVRLEPGRDLELERSTILDETLGHEELYGLFCVDPIEIELARKSLMAGGVPTIAGCTIERFQLEKKRP